ncbi:MAG: Wzz/FepE/Etk N-terminal domain-containing protein [candidate division KSB1 bacterium]|nr:Wzz/FepE/Etk N-terminal domain-containing protein [candidate division KSB1 bacterium]
MQNGQINGSEHKEWKLEDYLDLVLRRRWLILIVFVLVAGVTAFYALSRPEQYASSITFSN